MDALVLASPPLYDDGRRADVSMDRSGRLRTDAGCFQAVEAATVQIAATTTSANVAISGLTAGGQVRISNGSADVRVEFGSANTVTATTPAGGTGGSLQVKAGSVEMFSVPAGTTHVAAKADAGTSTVEFTPGTGV